MLVYIDTHTHSQDESNCLSIVNVPLERVDDFASHHTKSFYSVGIHPWEVHTIDTSVFEKLESLLLDERIKAIGECGVDRNAKATIKEQIYYFERQVQLSEKYSKPLIIHCVAAFNEMIVLRKKWKPTQEWIMHGFRAKPQMAKQLLKHGFVLSYGSRFNAESVVVTPIDRLCIETDDADIEVSEVYASIAAIKKCHPSELNAACSILRLYVC